MGRQVELIYAGRSYPATLIKSSKVPGTDRLVELTARVEVRCRQVPAARCATP